MITSMADVFKETTLSEFLKSLINNALGYTRNSRACSGLSDSEFVFIGIWRVLSQSVSGREFIQSIRNEGIGSAKKSTYFETIKSERRLRMLRDVDTAFSSMINNELKKHEVDYLGDFPELKGRLVLAGDGHTIEHAAHAKRDKKGRIVPVSNIHLLDLHTGIGMHFTDVQGNGNRKHEIKAFRNELLRIQGVADSNLTKRPIIIYDRAIVDKRFWSRQKLMKRNGMDVITRTKKNMKFLFQIERSFDSSLPINNGVVADFSVGADNAVSMRLIVYVNPEDGKRYEFLTTNNDLEPGLISWLYLLRWKIEKVFDTLKNKLQEKKAWANGEIAQEIHSRFCHLARNFLMYILHLMGHSFDITEEKLEKKRERQIKDRLEKAKKKGRSLHPQQLSKCYFFQLSCQFVRVVRNLFHRQTPVFQLLGSFREAMTGYY